MAKELLKISTFAKQYVKDNGEVGCSVQNVYQMIRNGVINKKDVEVIDGVTFINTERHE